MNGFQLSCESTVDFPYDYMASRDISVLFYTYMVGDKEYVDDMGRQQGASKKFYQDMREGANPVTSQINMEIYREYFEKLLEKGDVLHIAFGTGLTNSYNNAKIVAEQLNQKYTDRKLVVIDSLCGGGGYGILVDCAADLKDRGQDINSVANWVVENRQNVHHQFFSTQLSHLKKCGRISGLTAFVGTILGICPLFRLNRNGKIVSHKKARGYKKAMIETIDEIKKSARLNKEFGNKFVVAHSDCLDKAEETREKLVQALGIENKEDIKLFDIGTVIGAHCGWGTVVVFFMADLRPE